jgi:Rrf2 family iron-sulfur cluster assembly transcriptional regulator
VAQIIDAVNETVDATGCGGTADCQQGEVCLTHYLWCDLSKQIHTFLSDISLSNLVERQEVQSISARQDARNHQGEPLALAEI